MGILEDIGEAISGAAKGVNETFAPGKNQGLKNLIAALGGAAVGSGVSDLGAEGGLLAALSGAGESDRFRTQVGLEKDKLGIQGLLASIKAQDKDKALKAKQENDIRNYMKTIDIKKVEKLAPEVAKTELGATKLRRAIAEQEIMGSVRPETQIFLEAAAKERMRRVKDKGKINPFSNEGNAYKKVKEEIRNALGSGTFKNSKNKGGSLGIENL